jgi:molybdenum cofactor cytidylyltransferase
MGPSSAAIVLAAGAARRMGCCKALLPLGGRPLLLRHLDLLAEVVDEIIVVTGAYADEVSAAARGHGAPVRLVHNPAWATTDMAASLGIGLGASACARALCLPCDSVPAAAPALRALLAADGVIALGHRGAPGHPVCADRAALLGAVASGGLRALRPALLEAGDGLCLHNLNAPADLDALRAQVAWA